jgi:hypothetical protein
MKFPYRTILQSAFVTTLTLFGGLLAGGVAGNLIFETLSGHSVPNPSALHVTLGIFPAVTGVVAGSGAWGWAMGGLAGAQNRWRMVFAGILGFVPTTIILAIVLLNLEGVVVVATGVQLPTHRVFTLLFVPAAFLIAGISAWAIGRGLRDIALAGSLLWRVGLAAALAFLVVNLVMEASGWVVGAPGAAARYTMLTVLFAGNLGAALAGGAVLGWMLATTTRKPG